MNLLWLIVRKNWQPIAFAVIVGAVILSFQHIKSQRDKAVEDLRAYKNLQNIAVIKEAAKQKNNFDNARAKIALDNVKAQNELNDVLNENQTLKDLTEKLRRHYATKPIKPSVDIGNTIMLSPSSCDGTITKVTATTSGPTSSEPVPDTTCLGLRAEKEDLEQAAAVETIYYNQCREMLDADALVCPRESAP